MDEITYWIYTKRAPCLMNYDKLVKNRLPESSSKYKKPLSISDDPKTPSPKKKKRKLTILDDSNSDKGVLHRNVYFQSSNQPAILRNAQSSKSSDVNFNNKKTCQKEKPKRRGLKKNIRSALRKKHASAASTPKVTTTLRRSLRNSYKGNESHLLDTSFEVFNGGIKSPNKTNHLEISKQKIDKTTIEVQVAEIGRTTTKEKLKGTVNGKFEDLSDVSGFTANYIRSTKLDSTKNGKQIGSKNMQSLLKESQQVQIVPLDTIHDESVHSSQNCLNVADNKKKTKSRSSPISKPLFIKTVKNTKNLLNSCQQDLNHSLQLRSNTTTRYSKRVLNNLSRSEEKPPICKASPRKSKKVTNNTINIDCSERKENPGETLSRTRSGRSLALTIRQSDNSILFVNTADALQELTPKCRTVRNSLKKPKTNDLLKSFRKKSLNKNGESMAGGRESSRDKSGFAACFSDSDDDKPLKSHKYFC